MRVLIQRSKESRVCVQDEVISSISSGLVVFVGFTEGDTFEDITAMVKDKVKIKKILNLRIFDDEKGIMNKSILEVGGEILSISQFTLYADTKKGNRPSYIRAMNGASAIKLYDAFNEELSKYIGIQTGIFGADMQVNILNDGPITIWLDSKE